MYNWVTCIQLKILLMLIRIICISNIKMWFYAICSNTFCSNTFSTIFDAVCVFTLLSWDAKRSKSREWAWPNVCNINTRSAVFWNYKRCLATMLLFTQNTKNVWKSASVKFSKIQALTSYTLCGSVNRNKSEIDPRTEPSLSQNGVALAQILWKECLIVDGRSSP